MSNAGIHKPGTDDGWHGVIELGGRFPPEKDRYHLYIGTQTRATNTCVISDLVVQIPPVLPIN